MEHDIPPPLATGPGASGEPDTPGKDDRDLAMLAHLLGIFTGFLGPLIIYLTRGDDASFVKTESREALNFQIFIAIAFLLIGVASCLTFGLAFLLVPLLGIYDLICCVLGAMKSKEGLPYRYPLTLRLLG